MFQDQDGFDQSGDPGRGVQMPDIGLDRTDGAETFFVRMRPEGFGQGLYLDRVAERSARPVGLDIANVLRRDPGPRHCRGDDLGLAVQAGSGKADAGGAVVVHGARANDRVDGVAVGQGVR